jgi:hypothetical protein
MSFFFLKHKQYGQHMRKITSIIYGLFAAANSCAVAAYDVNTHAAMTAEAIRQSVITATPNTSPLFKRLHLRDKDYAIGTYYIDLGSLGRRFATPFEREIMRDVREANPTNLIVPTAESIPGWILRGAIREDDNTKETPAGTREGDEPGGVFDRVFGHFHDPVRNRGLTVLGNTLGPVATDWATKKDAILNGIGFGGRKNYYNLPSAREAMWRALTLKSWDNGVLGDDVEPTNWSPPNKEALRHAYWATMFRSVGDVVHIVQDMGQPQHTRNDAHGGLGCVPGTNACAGGHASFIESYMKARTLREDRFKLRVGGGSSENVVKTTVNQLQYAGYTKPMFAKAEDYFVSANGAGLANYSNRGFYSYGTNISSLAVPYPSPPPFGAGLTPVTLKWDDPDPNKRPRDIAGDAIPGATITFLTGNVVDSAGGADASNVKLTTVGYWDQFLKQQGTTSQYTLNHYNYDDQARLLIPRAVAYSAGLIDYFFRGEMEIDLPDEGVYAVADYGDTAVSNASDGGFNKLKLKLTNKTADITVSGGGGTSPQTLKPSGIIVAIVKFRRNRCYVETSRLGEWQSLKKSGYSDAQLKACRDSDPSKPDPEEIVVSDPTSLSGDLANGVQQALVFNFPSAKRIPINAVDVTLQVAYRGPLGAEDDAVLVATKDISEPTTMQISNDRDYDYSGSVQSDGSCKWTTSLIMPPEDKQKTYKVTFNEASPMNYIATTKLLPGQYSALTILGATGEGVLKSKLFVVEDNATTDWYSDTLAISTINDNGVVTATPLPKYVSVRGIYLWEGFTSQLPNYGVCPSTIAQDINKQFPDYNPLSPRQLTALAF